MGNAVGVDATANCLRVVFFCAPPSSSSPAATSAPSVADGSSSSCSHGNIPAIIRLLLQGALPAVELKRIKGPNAESVTDLLLLLQKQEVCNGLRGSCLPPDVASCGTADKPPPANTPSSSSSASAFAEADAFYSGIYFWGLLSKDAEEAIKILHIALTGSGAFALKCLLLQLEERHTQLHQQTHACLQLDFSFERESLCLIGALHFLRRLFPSTLFKYIGTGQPLAASDAPKSAFVEGPISAEDSDSLYPYLLLNLKAGVSFHKNIGKNRKQHDWRRNVHGPVQVR
ncbi:pantothenate kinase related protein [Cyclospora cayetanensis]|uniref:Pantothenate kinase related protein n=1 Tax=Cyclospora cayetanensis TaxID=88456 RepID=A0A1D3CZI5_9EIME|nr:pantothenate kinase related protein [Cyclospora cayetanensis]